MSAQKATRGLAAVAAGIALASCAFALAARPQVDESPQEGQQAAAVVEQGVFILHKFEQPVGEETYQIKRSGESLAVKMDFTFTDRGTLVPLTAAFRAAADLTPEAYEIKGKNSRQSSIDEAVEIQPDKVRLRDRDKWTRAARPRSSLRLRATLPPRCRCGWCATGLHIARRRSFERFRAAKGRSNRVGRTRSVSMGRERRSIATRLKD